MNITNPQKVVRRSKHKLVEAKEEKDPQDWLQPPTISMTAHAAAMKPLLVLSLGGSKFICCHVVYIRTVSARCQHYCFVNFFCHVLARQQDLVRFVSSSIYPVLLYVVCQVVLSWWALGSSIEFIVQDDCGGFGHRMNHDSVLKIHCTCVRLMF